jgi:hypothetical protein
MIAEQRIIYYSSRVSLKGKGFLLHAGTPIPVIYSTVLGYKPSLRDSTIVARLRKATSPPQKVAV